MHKCPQCRKNDAELLTAWERIKNWLFYKINYTFFAEDFEDLRSQKYTQGFTDGRLDGIKSEKESFERYKQLLDTDRPSPTQEIIDREIAKLLSPVDLRNVMTVNTAGKVYIGGEEASDGLLSNLKSEAQALKNFAIWGILHDTVKELAHKAMFREGDSIEQMRKGRSILYVLDTQKKYIDTLITYKNK